MITILSFWLFCGILSYVRFIYIDKMLDKESNPDLYQLYTKTYLFYLSIFGGAIVLLYILWFDLQFLWIEVKHWLGMLYDKLFDKGE